MPLNPEELDKGDLMLIRHLAYYYSKDAPTLKSQPTKQEIAMKLCGMSGKTLALNFMAGNVDEVVEFLNNVSYCDSEGTPYILKAIRLHLKVREKDFLLK